MSPVETILLHAAMITVPVGLAVGVVWLKFRDSLTGRLFTHVGFIIWSLVILTFTLGTLGMTPVTVVATFTPSILISLVTMWRLHRLVVATMTGHVQRLTARQGQLATVAQQTAAAATEQAATVQEVTTTVEELGQTSAVAAEAARAVLSSSEEAVEAGERGLAATAEAVKVMEIIAGSQALVDDVNELAEQSKMLAVNAGIEAARAGEHGRGFAVVAQEVRALATRSQKATTKIRQAIAQTESGRAAVEASHQVLVQLAEALRESADRAQQIAGAAGQQSAGIDQITDAMRSVDQGSRDTANTAHELKAATADLGEVSDHIHAFVTGRALDGADRG